MDSKTKKIFIKLSKELPHFKDGRINYKNAKTAMVVSLFIRCKDELLVLKRSRKVAAYKGLWNTVAGYYDEPKSVRQKALEELNEETGITKKDVLKVSIGPVINRKDAAIGTTWISHKVLVELKRKPKIRLDFEHTEYKWVKEEQLKSLEMVPRFKKSYRLINKFLDEK